MVLNLAKNGIGNDQHGHRSEFVKLARQAATLNR
jgi:hypothetical protein